MFSVTDDLRKCTEPYIELGPLSGVQHCKISDTLSAISESQALIICSKSVAKSCAVIVTTAPKAPNTLAIIDISNIDMRVKFWLEMNEVQTCFYSKFEETLSNLK